MTSLFDAMATSSSDGVSTATFGAPTSGDENYAAPAVPESTNDGTSVDGASIESATRSTSFVETTSAPAGRPRPSVSPGGPSGAQRSSDGNFPSQVDRHQPSSDIPYNVHIGTPPGTPPLSARGYGPARPTTSSSARRPSTTASRDGGAAPSVGHGSAPGETHVVGAEARLDALLFGDPSGMQNNKDEGPAADGVIEGSGSSPSGSATLPPSMAQATNVAIPTISGMAGAGQSVPSGTAPPLAPTTSQPLVPAGAQKRVTTPRPSPRPASLRPAAADRMDMAEAVQAKRVADEPPAEDRGRSSKARQASLSPVDAANLQRIKDDVNARALEAERLQALRGAEGAVRLAGAVQEARAQIQALTDELELAKFQYSVISTAADERQKSLVIDIKEHIESKAATEQQLFGANRRIDELEAALKLDKAQVLHLLAKYEELRVTMARDSSSSSQASAQVVDLSNSVASLKATCEALQNNVAKGDADHKDLQSKMDISYQGHLRDVAIAVARIGTLENELLLAQAPRDPSGSAVHFCLECSDKNAKALLLLIECERLREELRLRENRNDSDRKGYEGSIQIRENDNRELITQFHQESDELRLLRFLTNLRS